jgi:hypothetical protein
MLENSDAEEVRHHQWSARLAGRSFALGLYSYVMNALILAELLPQPCPVDGPTVTNLKARARLGEIRTVPVGPRYSDMG